MKPLITLFSLCVMAAWIPLWSNPTRPDNANEQFPGWSLAPVPADLTPVLPSAREARFAAGFPGQIGVFTDGPRTYVVRWVRTATRKLHPASDCLRALGYATQPAPIIASADGTRWGTVNAQRATEKLRVRERIVDSAGHEWTDVSAWFWSAVLDHTAGPWWAVTVFEPVNPDAIKSPL
jgi:hypothetical protein